MILVRNIRLPLSCPDPEQEAVRQAYRTLRLRGNAPAQAGVAKLSVDARHGTPVLVYTIAITLHDEGEESALAGASPCVCFTRKPDFTFPVGQAPLKHRPVVVGLGPAGLFAALLLARNVTTPLCWSAVRPWRTVWPLCKSLSRPARWTPTPISSLARAAQEHSRTAS